MQLIPLIGRRRVLAGAAVAVVTALVLIHPITSDVRTMEVLGKKARASWAATTWSRTTRSRARGDRARGADQLLPDRALQVAQAPVRARLHPRHPPGRQREAPDGTSITYAASLNPEVIDQYSAEGLLPGDDDVADPRPGGERQGAGGARLLRPAGARVARSTRRRPTTRARSRCRCTSTSPTTTTRPAFNRPGPEIKVYRLNNCQQGSARCRTSPWGPRAWTRASGPRSSRVERTRARPWAA